MNVKNKAEYYADFFKSIDVVDGTTRVVLKDDAPQELRDAVHEAHGDKLPNDFIYSTFAGLLCRISEYDAETVDELRDNGYDHEIIDGYVDIYTHDLLQWLASDIDNLEYMSRVMAERVYVEEDGAWQVLATMQYYAIEDVMQYVLSLLENNQN